MVEPGQTFVRQVGPALRCKVLRVEDDWAFCRMYRESGSSLGGERPVPVELLEDPDLFRAPEGER